MTDKELEYAKKYKKISDVSEKECYLGGNCCGTCMYCTDGNRYYNFIGFEHKYCTKARNEERPQDNLADEVWKLYEKHHSHLATHVIEYGDELKDLLGKYQKDGTDMRSGFQLTELRRWLTSQGYSEGTIDDKINEFTRFVEKIRGKE